MAQGILARNLVGGRPWVGQPSEDICRFNNLFQRLEPFSNIVSEYHAHHRLDRPREPAGSGRDVIAKHNAGVSRRNFLKAPRAGELCDHPGPFGHFDRGNRGRDERDIFGLHSETVTCDTPSPRAHASPARAAN